MFVPLPCGEIKSERTVMELQRSHKRETSNVSSEGKKRKTRARIKLGPRIDPVKNRSRTFFVLHRDGISGEKETNYARGGREGGGNVFNNLRHFDLLSIPIFQLPPFIIPNNEQWKVLTRLRHSS